MSFNITGIYLKDNRKNNIIIWVHRKILGFASWFLNFADVSSCNGCIHHDDYGCMRAFINAECKYESIDVVTSSQLGFDVHD